ncbi:hypothetical protein IMCC21906_03260 (plasmid) [Spongiibacter sp. IMCC21906]|nr:hypothetical protein IMCC21906_03260 [Spongiibacter sp. IMCC21906]
MEEVKDVFVSFFAAPGGIGTPTPYLSTVSAFRTSALIHVLNVCVYFGRRKVLYEWGHCNPHPEGLLFSTGEALMPPLVC